MAIAKYFSKNLLAINQLLHSNHDELVRVLSNHVVSIVFGKNASSTFEGRAALDLITRLLARLYPRLKFVTSDDDEEMRQQLSLLAQSINGEIEIVADDTTADSLIILGDVSISSLPDKSDQGLTIFVGSAGWNAWISSEHSVSFSDSENPFGCGVACCLGAATLFRHVFRGSLGELPRRYEGTYSVYHNRLDGSANPILGQVKLIDAVVAGMGAIGNGLVWALTKLTHLGGSLHLVDKELLADTNLQRYVMAEEKHLTVPTYKVKYLSDCFPPNPDLNIVPHEETWAEYVSHRNDPKIHCVAVAIDNKKDRIGIQSSLPNVIFNAFTEPEVIGISRHLDFSTSPCLACGYIPVEKEKNYINEVADNLNIPQLSEVIKDYINKNQPVDARLLAVISEANHIQVEAIQHFSGMFIPQFYSEFVCGGVLLGLSGNVATVGEIDAPMAFQSALAGILLAADVIKFHQGADFGTELRTDIYPLQILGHSNPLNRPLQKDTTGRCLCRDDDFQIAYSNKWC